MNNFEFDRMYTFIYHTDMVKADRFYRELLGLEAEVSNDKPVILCLGVVDDGDIHELYNRLKDAGVKMRSDKVELMETEGKVFFCEDPEGYIIEIVQRPKGTS